MVTIAPAIIPSSRAELVSFVDQVPFASEIHVDVVDGVFVPFSAWPVGSPDDPESVRALLERFSLEIDLMTAEPLRYAEWWLAAGADSLVFHAETISASALAAFAADHKVSVGVASSLDFPMDDLLPYLKCADYVQVMGIRHVGSQGQPFDSAAKARVAEIRAAAPHLMVSVDGSVNPDTLPGLLEAGAMRAVVGSYIVKASDPFAAYETMRALTHQQ